MISFISLIVSPVLSYFVLSCCILVESGDLVFKSRVSRSSIVVLSRSSPFHVYLKLPSIAQNASSACAFEACHAFVASTTASSPTLVIPRVVANSQGVCHVACINFCSSSALNLLARVEILAPFGAIALPIAFAVCHAHLISLVIDLATQVAHP